MSRSTGPRTRSRPQGFPSYTRAMYQPSGFTSSSKGRQVEQHLELHVAGHQNFSAFRSATARYASSSAATAPLST